MITAPFNFVPLSKKVFFPPWADDISHDIPFVSQESGEITIRLKAEAPLFIKDHERQEHFCSYDDRYFIPGSSLKGMLRNVLEIMSFSKMSMIDDTNYAVRDLKYEKYMEKVKEGVRCGWLYKKGSDYYIEDCGEPYRISYHELAQKFDSFKLEYFYTKKEEEGVCKGSFDNARSPYKLAKNKYALIDEDLTQKDFTFSTPVKDGPGRMIVRFDDKGHTKGKIVLTGHPSPRKEACPDVAPELKKKIKNSGKIYDFVFPSKADPEQLKVEDIVFKNFKFAYFDGNRTQPRESEDWSYWKEILEKEGGRVPVFFHKAGKYVSSFGLSQLYKFPYSRSVFDTLVGDHKRDEVDLAEGIFGYSRQVEGELASLKGRVHVSHAHIEGDVREEEGREVLLGKPKASYYPIYIVQNGKTYMTYMDANAVLAGWKRYPVHKTFRKQRVDASTQTKRIHPLPAGTEFTFKIRVHNLRDVELGALFSALTFHNTQGCFHSLGMAKPFGYGKVSLKIESTEGFGETPEIYMQRFEAAMNSVLFDGEPKWHDSEQICNLLTMASEQENGGSSKLAYMDLPAFAKEKNTHAFLDRYVNLDHIRKVCAQQYSTKEMMSVYRKAVEPFVAKNLIKAKRAEEKHEWQKIHESENIVDFENYMNNYSESRFVERAKQRIEELIEEGDKRKKEEERKVARDEWRRLKESPRAYNDVARLKKYIEEHPDSEVVSEVKRRIEELGNRPSVAERKLDKLSAEKVRAKEVNRILKENKGESGFSEEEMSYIREQILRLLSGLNKKKRERFFKEAKLAQVTDSTFEKAMKDAAAEF